MEQQAWGLNAVTVGGEQLLLAEASGAGIAVHLVADDGDGHGRPAVPAHWFRSDMPGYVSGIARYDRGALESARWSPRTLCGREWMSMVAGDSGPLYRDQTIQLAPTCRRCLTILDRRFPPPNIDDRLGVVTELVARAVDEHGSAEIIGVPGDQVAPLRTELRRVFRKRFGHVGQTVLVNDVLLVTCDQATEQVRGARRQEAALRLDNDSIAEPPDDSGWRIYWHTWA